MGNCVSPKKYSGENQMKDNIASLNKYIDKLNEKNKELENINIKQLYKINIDNDNEYSDIDNREQQEYINICDKYKNIINRQINLVDEFNNTSQLYQHIIQN